MMIYDRRLDLRRLEAAEGALTWALELEAHRRRRVVVMASWRECRFLLTPAAAKN